MSDKFQPYKDRIAAAVIHLNTTRGEWTQLDYAREQYCIALELEVEELRAKIGTGHPADAVGKLSEIYTLLREFYGDV